MTSGRAGAAMSRAFTPREVAGCRLFFWCDVGVTVVGGVVSNWKELVGAGATHDWTAAGAARPTFNTSSATWGGRKSFTFNGSAMYFTPAAALPFTSGVTIAIAYKPDDVNTTRSFLTDLNVGGTSLLWQSSSSFQWVDETGHIDQQAATISLAAHVFVFTSTSSAQKYYLDVVTTPTATGATTFGTFQVTEYGTRNQTSFIKGETRHVAIFSGVLSDADRARYSRWAANDTGVAVAA